MQRCISFAVSGMEFHIDEDKIIHEDEKILGLVENTSFTFRFMENLIEVQPNENDPSIGHVSCLFLLSLPH